MAATFLTNQFLIAMPGMADPTFAGSVVYLCEHTEKGALGLVINKPIDITLKDLEKVLYFASYVVTQLGFDARKSAELIRYVRLVLRSRVPVIGSVYLLTAGAARLMSRGEVPGCYVIDRLLKTIEERSSERTTSSFFLNRTWSAWNFALSGRSEVSLITEDRIVAPPVPFRVPCDEPVTPPPRPPSRLAALPVPR